MSLFYNHIFTIVLLLLDYKIVIIVLEKEIVKASLL